MPETEKDVVAMPSLRSDGTPDQTEGYKVLDEAGDHKDAGEFTEFREVTQETVLPPPDSAAAADVAEGQQGATPEESTGVAGTSEALAETAAGLAEAAVATPEQPEPAPPTPEQQQASGGDSAEESPAPRKKGSGSS